MLYILYILYILNFTSFDIVSILDTIFYHIKGLISMGLDLLKKYLYPAGSRTAYIWHIIVLPTLGGEHQ